MSWQAWLTLAVVVVTIVLLASERVSTPYAILGAVTLLLTCKVIDGKEALSGFSSEAPATIAALYVVAAAAQATGALDRITALAAGRRGPVPGQRTSRSSELTRVLIPAATLSAFIYNTPTTGMLAPQVSDWARRSKRSPSWYLIPLNFAILLGGMATSIGTTTTVVVSGLLSQSGRSSLGIFEISPVGVPIAVIGVIVVILLAPRLVPSRADSAARVSGNPRDFSVEMVVRGSGPMVGKSVAEAGLRNLEGVYLAEIERDGREIAPVAPEEVLAAGDRLVFVGNVSSILDLQRLGGLQSAEEPHFAVTGRGPGRRFYEVVIAAGSPLAGQTLKEANFRSRYQAAVVAIHRAGEQVRGKFGSIALRPGDVLLTLGPDKFHERFRGSNEILVVAPNDEHQAVNREKSVIVLLVIAAFLIVSTSGLLDVLTAAMLAALAVVALRVLTPAQARDAVDMNVIVALAASFGLGAAISSSGLAKEVAKLLISALDGFGDRGVLAGVLIATLALTQLITNNAAAVVMFPIAMETASRIGVNPRAFAIIIAVGASMSYLTPIGYQTNLIVYGMGGHRFWDFLKLGTVLCFVIGAVTLILVPLAFPLH